MRLIRIFNLLLILLLSASCSRNEPDYRLMWQHAHHLDDAQMAAMYGEPRDDMNCIFGAILEAVEGNWDKVADLTAGSRTSDLFAYYHNLRHFYAPSICLT